MTPVDVEVVVIGAGQAGLSAAGLLAERGFHPGVDLVVLDANPAPGGAWQHRWPTLTMGQVHGIHPLLGEADRALADPADDAAAREVVPAHFARFERARGLEILRPVRVERVEEAGDDRLLVVTDSGSWRTRSLLNATGSWSRPFLPAVPGREHFTGEQLHTADYPGPEPFVGRHVVIVGGGHSAVQHLAELSAVTDTTWVTRRPPAWRDTPFDRMAARAAVARIERDVAAGRRPRSVVAATGLLASPEVARAGERGALQRYPMFSRLASDGPAWADGSRRGADVVLWATGFRPALDHLSPLGLREPGGGIRMDGTQVADEPRIHLLGYGPSASTIGADRAARQAVAAVRRRRDTSPSDLARRSA